jgi:uncharacterized protein (DUF1501 family)
MPVPAGTGLDRRRFLLGAAGGFMSVYGAGRLGLGGPALADGIAQAATLQGPQSPVLVSVFLAGGIDSLSLLAPTEDPLYRKLRPTLALAPTAGVPFTEDARLRWHPSAAPIATLHDAGKVTVFPGIGYADPDMSHFTSRHYWEVGAMETRLETGWLGRYLDVKGSSTNPFQGLSLDGEMNPTLATARNPVAARLGDSQRRSSAAAVAQVAEAASEVGVVRRALKPFANANGGPAYTSPVTYPTAGDTDFPQRLAGLAAMLDRGLPLRCVAMTTDTQFDTHSAQAATFDPGIAVVAQSLAAFQADLEARGLADRVLVHVWSEFGRRAQQNGSAGTDHGASGTSMLIGTRAGGKMIGEWPDLAHLDANGNQRENVDFRGVYCSLIEQWFGEDAAAVIPSAARFPRYKLVQ